MRLSFFFSLWPIAPFCGARSGLVDASPQTDWLRRVSFLLHCFETAQLHSATCIKDDLSNLAGWKNSKRPRRVRSSRRSAFVRVMIVLPIRQTRKSNGDGRPGYSSAVRDTHGGTHPLRAQLVMALVAWPHLSHPDLWLIVAESAEHGLCGQNATRNVANGREVGLIVAFSVSLALVVGWTGEHVQPKAWRKVKSWSHLSKPNQGHLPVSQGAAQK